MATAEVTDQCFLEIVLVEVYMILKKGLSCQQVL
uniref:Uncharacterized protein n=1 Tax=Rhizophora mucronata TaxID=61149 RepID=A0A2P2MYN4_RHIMU